MAYYTIYGKKKKGRKVKKFVARSPLTKKGLNPLLP